MKAVVPLPLSETHVDEPTETKRWVDMRQIRAAQNCTESR